MAISDLLRRHYRKYAGERSPPEGVPDQRDLIREFFDTEGERWLFVFDAGRYDVFDQLSPAYVAGDLRRCWNGGVAYTGDWAMRNLRLDLSDRGLFSWLPLRNLDHADYDGREHFGVAPDVRPDRGVDERLRALGYADGPVTTDLSTSPATVNASVRDHRDDLNGGVVRYVKPHPPLEGLEDLTSTRGKTRAVAHAIDRGDLTTATLRSAYRATYEVAFEYAVDLIPDLGGEIVITADHGTCLDCGQFFHGRNHALHDHMTVVPWFSVEGCA